MNFQKNVYIYSILYARKSTHIAEGNIKHRQASTPIAILFHPFHPKTNDEYIVQQWYSSKDEVGR